MSLELKHLVLTRPLSTIDLETTGRPLLSWSWPEKSTLAVYVFPLGRADAGVAWSTMVPEPPTPRVPVLCP